MKKFQIITDGQIYEGSFDTNSTNKDTLYVLFQHNGMIGVANPTKINLSLIKSLLFDNMNEVNYEIFNKENDFTLIIGEEE